jgi:hypothetical protein
MDRPFQEQSQLWSGQRARIMRSTPSVPQHRDVAERGPALSPIERDLLLSDLPSYADALSRDDADRGPRR